MAPIFYTRNLTKIAAPQWFKDKMPIDMALDGEFFIKRGHFNTTSGIIRKLVTIHCEWEQIHFRCSMYLVVKIHSKLD